MIELSIALVLISAIAGYLTNKFLDQRQQELDEKVRINKLSSATMEDLPATVTEALKAYDDRINVTWGTISSIKEELNAYKMQAALRKH